MEIKKKNFIMILNKYFQEPITGILSVVKSSLT